MGLLFSNRLYKLCSRRTLHQATGVQFSRENQYEEHRIFKKENSISVENTSSKASPPEISRESKLNFNLPTHGQHSVFDIFENMGESKNQKMTILSKEIWEILVSKQTWLLWSIYPTHSTNCQTWTHPNGSLSTCLSQSLPEIRNPNSRFIHFKDAAASSTMCCMKARSL